MAGRPDILILGGGIAGASLGAELALSGATVTLLEAEDRPGHHSTGRSAAHFIESYGPPAVRAFSRFTRPFLEAPPEEIAPESLLRRRPIVWIARPEDKATLDALVAAESALAPLPVEEIVRRVPILRPEMIAAAAIEETAADIDVDRLHQGYLRRLRHHGGTVVTKARAGAVARRDGLWLVETAAGLFEAPILVNAAGAWAAEIGRMAGLPPVALTPLRRSAALLPAPEDSGFADWPLVGDMGERYYFKPESGKLLVSPADETPVDPHDAFVDDMDLAEGLDRFAQATTYPLERVERSWAGLRSFANDRVPLVGYDRAEGGTGFFWFAGQGGYGIQTSHGMAVNGAALIQGRPVPEALATLGLKGGDLDPRRAMPADLAH